MLDATFEEFNPTLARKISWRGLEFSSRSNFTSEKIKEKFAHQTKSCSYDRTMARLVVSTPQLLNEYLTGIPRCPFGNTESDTVIVLESNNTTFESPIYTELMEKICKDYGKINVVLMLPYISQKVAFYDPFTVHKENEDWGDLKWIEPNNIFKVQANKLKNFRGYPITVSIFQRYPTVIVKKRIPTFYMFDSVLAENLKYSFGFGGMDAIVLGTLKKYYNFGGVAKGPTDKEQYGHKEANGRFTGNIFTII